MTIMARQFHLRSRPEGLPQADNFELVEQDLHEKVTIIGAGKLGFPDVALLAFSLGCDLIHVAREAMLSVGCIQAQRCHSGHCPTGVATQSRWLMRGLVPTEKAGRLANYVVTLRKESSYDSWGRLRGAG